MASCVGCRNQQELLGVGNEGGCDRCQAVDIIVAHVVTDGRGKRTSGTHRLFTKSAATSLGGLMRNPTQTGLMNDPGLRWSWTT